MIRVTRILVPTDFSETSAAALKYGIELARAFNAHLHVLHVPEHPGQAAETEYPIGLFETMQNEAHDRLGSLFSDADARELRPQYAMRLGKADQEIVRYAKDQNVDLIVMGTHGRTGL